MFRHQGKYRTYTHNLQIASLLSFVAGLVNIVGFLSIQRLTTNVTGHFAYFIDESFNLNGKRAFVYLLYTLFFLLGAFTSNCLTEINYSKNEYRRFIIPVSIEILILAIAAFTGTYLIHYQPDTLACMLLFAMGLQNALVTIISNAIVRTTHLTGLFTDLGIELSQYLLHKEKERRKKLKSSIFLRFTIINFFFLGGITGGLLFPHFHAKTLYTGAILLFIGLFYDSAKLLKVIAIRKKRK